MMGRTAIGVLLVVICALLEGVGQVFLKKSVLGAVRWYLWISFGVVILSIETMIYSQALLFLERRPSAFWPRPWAERTIRRRG